MVTTEEISIRQRVIDWVQHEMDGGAELDAAVTVALDCVKAEGLGEAMLSEFGHGLIKDIWTEYNRAHRTALLTRPGAPRIDLDELRESPMDALIHIGGGKFVRLGDMVRGLCEAARRYYRTASEGMLREEYLFAKLEAGLQGDETVRMRYTDEDIWNFRAEFKLE